MFDRRRQEWAVHRATLFLKHTKQPRRVLRNSDQPYGAHQFRHRVPLLESISEPAAVSELLFYRHGAMPSLDLLGLLFPLLIDTYTVQVTSSMPRARSENNTRFMAGMPMPRSMPLESPPHPRIPRWDALHFVPGSLLRNTTVASKGSGQRAGRLKNARKPGNGIDARTHADGIPTEEHYDVEVHVLCW